MKIFYAPIALRDLDGILAYIRARSPSGARSVTLAIERATVLIARNPYVGSKTDEGTVYRFPIARYRYTIFYRVDPKHQIVQIVRIVHGSRIKDLRRIPTGE